MKEWKGLQKFSFPKIKEVILKEIPIPSVAQKKWDGETCFLCYEPDIRSWVTVNNWGHHRSEYPITDEADNLHLKRNTVYVGELCAGKFLYHFLKYRKSHPEEFFLKLFDILDDSRNFLDRQLELQHLPEEGKISKVPYIMLPTRQSLETLFRIGKEEDSYFEGLVIREIDGDGIWKVKTKRTTDVVVLGMAKDGKHYPRQKTGTLLVGLYHDNKFLRVGRVGIGFTEKQREEVYKEILKTKTGEDKYYVYCEPRIVLEISFNQLIETVNFEVDHTFRSATLKRFRPEKPVIDCKLSHQLPEVKPI